MFNKIPVEGKKVICIISGGNIDVTILSRVIRRGLLKSGRYYALNIELLDKPGQLIRVSKIIADLGGNVISIHHERASESSNINGCDLSRLCNFLSEGLNCVSGIVYLNANGIYIIIFEYLLISFKFSLLVSTYIMPCWREYKYILKNTLHKY